MAHEAELRARRITSNPTNLSPTASAVRNSTALDKGIYVITCDQDCYFLQGDSTVTATSSSNPLWAKERAEIHVRYGENDGYISVIRNTTDGAFSITRLES